MHRPPLAEIGSIAHAIVAVVTIISASGVASGDIVPIFDWDDLERELQPLFDAYREEEDVQGMSPFCEERAR